MGGFVNSCRDLGITLHEIMPRSPRLNVYGEEIRVTDREVFNMVDNLLRVEDIRAIGGRVLSLHEIRNPS